MTAELLSEPLCLSNYHLEVIVAKAQWNDDEDKTVNKLIERMQHDAQLCSDLLWCSGGKL